MDSNTRPYRPEMTQAGLAPTHAVRAVDEYGDARDLQVAGEFPLTIKVDDREVVTLMTLGTWPEALTLGYLRNQRLIEDLEEIRSVEVDWEREQVNVSTFGGEGIIDWERKLSKRTVTTGCGQGTVFSCTLDKLYEIRHFLVYNGADRIEFDAVPERRPAPAAAPAPAPPPPPSAPAAAPSS